MPRLHDGPSIASAVKLAIAVLLIALLYFGREIFIPFSLAILFTFLLAPIASRLERTGLGRIWSVAAVVTMTFTLFGGMMWIMAGQLSDLAQELPGYRANIQAKIQAIKGRAGSALGKATQTFEELGKEMSEPSRESADHSVTQKVLEPASKTEPVPVKVVEPPPNAVKIVYNYMDSVIGPLGTFGIVVIFVIFMLLERENLRDRVIRLLGTGQLNVTTQALNEAGERISRYLLMNLIVNVTYGVPVAVALWLIGVPNYLLWGLMATLLRFIPYVGPWIAASFPILVSFAAPDMWTPVYTIGMFVVLELFSNNVVEPWLYGSSTGMTSVAVLFAAVFWAWLWGPIGLFMSIPLTACLVVIGKYVPQLEFITIMLSDEPVLPEHMRFYQRLLAMDQAEVAEMTDTFLDEKPMLEVYDTILIPALGLAEMDRHRGRLDDKQQRFIYDSLAELVADAEERKADADAAKAVQEGEPLPAQHVQTSVSNPIMVLPARDEADQIAGRMLVHILRTHGIAAEAASVSQLKGEMIDRVESLNPPVVVISAVPPSAVSHSRYLCKRLHARIPNKVLLIGLWNESGSLEKAGKRVSCTEKDMVVGTLAEALKQLESMVRFADVAEDALNASDKLATRAPARGAADGLRAQPLLDMPKTIGQLPAPSDTSP